MGRNRAQRAVSLVLGTVATLIVVLGVLLAAGVWLLRTDDGLQWLIARVPGLTVTGLLGRPDGGPMGIARLEWRSGGLRLAVDSLEWRDARWRWRPRPGAWVGVELDAPRARRVEFVAAPDSGKGRAPPRPPDDLTLPVELVLRGLEVGTLQVDTLPALSDLRADVHLGADAGRAHDVPRLAFRTPQGRVNFAGRIGTEAPLPLQAQVELSSLPGATRGWQAQLRIDGTLAQNTVDAALQSDAGAHAQARATLAPFAAWPLAALEASTRDLDLAALAPGWPATRLTGRAVVHSSGMEQPVRVELDVANDTPGRWSEARLPLRTLRAVLAGRPDQRDRIDASTLELQLGGERPAGRVTGTGHWQGDRLEFALSIDGLQPSLLDARLAAMALGGPLQLELRGLPALGGGASSAPHLAGSLRTTLTGRVAQARRAPPVRVDAALAFDAPADELQVAIERLDASAGTARAQASATLRRDAARRWHLDSRGELARFDPAPWWPGADGSWGARANALNARWDAAIGWPDRATLQPGASIARLLAGQARVTLERSQLAGVPLEGRVALQAGGSGATVDASLQAAGNGLQLTGRSAPGAGDERWQVQLDAPALRALAPLAALVPAARGWMPQSGAVTARASAQGRWPALRTEGELQASDVRAGALQAQRIAARWSIPGTAAPAAPLSLTLDAAGLAQGERRLERLEATLSGTLNAHRIELTAASPVRPPAWADPLLPRGTGTPSGTSARLAGEGQWRRTADGSTWQGKLLQLHVASRGADAPAWIAARDVDAQLRFDGRGALAEASAAPGRVELLGAALRWRHASWRGGAAPRIALDAELEPLRIAPWLARLQPDFGWGGDLTLGGRFVVARGERFDADLVIERGAGDLTVTDEGGTQALGLTDLRLALAAHDGTWHFTQALAGANVGVLGGAQSLRMAPQAAWPAPDTVLEGVVELRVAHLGVWAPWLPPGWRLGGQLRTSASVGGRFGAPEYTGEVVGSELAVRNLLQGVDVRDGELAVTLRGADAKVERFLFKGGDGELRLTGGASFGATPRAQLRMQASRFRVLGRVDRRIVVSGSADLALQAKRITLDGRVVVDEGLIDVSRADAPSLGGDVVVERRPAAAPAPASPPADRSRSPGPLANANVALVVELGDKLRLRGRGLDTTLAGDLYITAPNGRLAINGTVRAEHGTFEAYGQKLDIERGALVFTGAVENPRLDILAVRPDLDLRVGVAVSGGALNPRVRLFSEPEMGELDKLSWLVMGRASEGLGRADTALLQRAAVALLAGQGSGGGPTDALLKNIGLDELSLRQTEEGDVRDTVVTVGKQLSQRWYVGYERGVNATTGTWQLIYRVARRLTVRAQGGEDNALDVIWTWRWN